MRMKPKTICPFLSGLGVLCGAGSAWANPVPAPGAFIWMTSLTLGIVAFMAIDGGYAILAAKGKSRRAAPVVLAVLILASSAFSTGFFWIGSVFIAVYALYRALWLVLQALIIRKIGSAPPGETAVPAPAWRPLVAGLLLIPLTVFLSLGAYFSSLQNMHLGPEFLVRQSKKYMARRLAAEKVLADFPDRAEALAKNQDYWQDSLTPFKFSEELLEGEGYRVKIRPTRYYFFPYNHIMKKYAMIGDHTGRMVFGTVTGPDAPFRESWEEQVDPGDLEEEYQFFKKITEPPEAETEDPPE